MSSAKHTQDTSTPLEAQLLFKEMPFQSRVDESRVDATLAKQRQAWWLVSSIPDLYCLGTDQHLAGDSDPGIALETLQFLDEQLWQKTYTEMPLYEDGWITAEIGKAPRDSQGRITCTKGVNVRALLANAWFRAGQQRKIMDIWIAFVEQGLLSPEGLEHPISWCINDMNVIEVAKVLDFFPAIKSSRKGPTLFPLQCRTDNIVIWLAIQIVRSGIKQIEMMIDLL